MITKPMLAGKCININSLTYPLLATPKLDGIRCLIIKGKAVSRKFKPIPNNYIRQTIELSINSLQFDGEILTFHVVDGKRVRRSFNDISGDVRRVDGRPDFEFHVFDYVKNNYLTEEYGQRMRNLAALQHLSPFVVKVLPQLFGEPEALSDFEQECIELGYEGIMVRGQRSPYKCGRSTENEGYLLKIKRFEDDEAKVVGFEELMHNDNVATKDAFGRTERSSHKENLRGAGVLGKLECFSTKWPYVFGIGSGYDAPTRLKLWQNRDKLVGKLVKFKHQPSGADERPRFPVFLGFRDEWDT